ncbi:hypothetical protein D3C74_481660 [compost metagenome]
MLPDHIRIVDGSVGTVSHLSQRLELGAQQQAGNTGQVQAGNVSFFSSSGRTEDHNKMRVALQYLSDNVL